MTTTLEPTAALDLAPPAKPAPRLLPRFIAAFAFGLIAVLGIGIGALYAWGLQYDGRVLPGVRIGTTDLSGLSREEAGARIAAAYQSLGAGSITLTGPDGQTMTMSYADVGRGPDTSALLDAAFAAGRQGQPLAYLIGAPRAAIHGVTLDTAVAYDHAKLAAAIDTLATAIDQTPEDASVKGAAGGFVVTVAKDGRAVDKAALLSTLDRQLAAVRTPASIALTVPVMPLAPAVATATAQAAQAAAVR